MSMRSRLLAASAAALVAGSAAGVAVALAARSSGSPASHSVQPLAVAPVVVIEPAIGTPTSRSARAQPTAVPQLPGQGSATPTASSGVSQQAAAGIAVPPLTGPAGTAGGSPPSGAAVALPGQLSGVAALGAPLASEAFQLAAQVNGVLSTLSGTLPH